MRYDPLEIYCANANRRTRRVWYGHGSSRLIVDDARSLPPAHAIDEAMASFERIDKAATLRPSAIVSYDRRPLENSLVAGLSAQLVTLDRQREHLAQLLHNIDE